MIANCNGKEAQVIMMTHIAILVGLWDVTRDIRFKPTENWAIFGTELNKRLWPTVGASTL
jgi:hypothetical protein